MRDGFGGLKFPQGDIGGEKPSGTMAPLQKRHSEEKTEAHVRWPGQRSPNSCLERMFDVCKCREKVLKDLQGLVLWLAESGNSQQQRWA